MTRKIGIIAALILCLIVTSSCTREEEGIAAYINGEKIETAELMLFASMNKAEVVKYFADKYGAEYTADFWRSDFGGESPRDMLRDAAMEELIPYKIKQKLAKKNELLDSCDYSDFLVRLEEENKQRKQKKESGGVVYGVTEYTPAAYYKDSMAKLEIGLRDLWMEKLDPDEPELLAYYEEIKDGYYKKLNESNITVYSFDFSKEEEAKALLERANQGEDVQQAAEAAGAKIENMDIDNESLRYITFAYPGVDELIEKKQAPFAAGLYGTAGEICFVRVNEIKDGGYKSFEDVKQNVLSMYTERDLNGYIEKLVKKAKIKYTKEYKEIDFSGI